DPGMRVLVLELEDLAFDFDRVGLDVVLRKRVVTLRRRTEHRDADSHEQPRAHARLHYFVSFTKASRSALVIGRSGLGAWTMTCRSKSSCSRSMFCISVAFDALTGFPGGGGLKSAVNKIFSFGRYAISIASLCSRPAT